MLRDKEREAMDGHDGTWVAHPDLVPVAMNVFNNYMRGENDTVTQRKYFSSLRPLKSVLNELAH